MCVNCRPLIKAIDAYIQKVDSDLSNELEEQGFLEAEKTVEYIQDIEDGVAEALLEETDYILAEAEKAVDLETFAEDIWLGVKLNDTVKDKLVTVFTENFDKFMPEFIEYYIAQTDRDLKLLQVSKRTMAWVKSWSKKLGEIMKLSSHNEIERILENGLKDGKGIAAFTREILDSGIRDEYYKARRVAVTEVLRAHSVAQQEAFMQSPAVREKMWKHTGSYRNDPRKNHIDMNGKHVPVNEPFELDGIKGDKHNPMYPRDTILPPEESINCHCICQPVVDEDILGLSLEERQRLQQEAIDEMDEEWEKELDAKNKAKAGIDEDTVKLDWLRAKDREDQIKYFGGGEAGKQRLALIESGVISTDEELEKLYKVNDKGNRVRKTLTELAEDGIFTVDRSTLSHSTVGDFSNLKNPKKPASQKNGGNMKGGGHSQANIDELNNRGIAYRIEKTYSNGVRIGGIENHKEKAKILGESGHSWFPEDWDEDKIRIAGTYTANKPQITIEKKTDSGEITGYLHFSTYNEVTIGIFSDVNKNPKTIFPDDIQRTLKVND